MGWLRALHSTVIEQQHEFPRAPQAADVKLKVDKNHVTHIEELSIQDQSRKFPLAHPETADHDLPFISAAEFALISAQGNNNGTGLLYITIDDIVYDCTQFVHDHPGGPRVIESFKGQDCSWQFWRFHSRENMKEWGRPLRIARTKGVQNRWKERPRFVGLRPFSGAGDSGW